MKTGSNFNFRLIAAMLGTLLIIMGLFMLTSIGWSLHYEEPSWRAFVYSGAIAIAAGIFLRFLNRNNDQKEVKKRDGYLIVTLGWLSMSIFGALPYLFSGAIPHPVDAWFETMSGFTTTGATILTDIESLPKGILYWRSLTHWIGGMGIIVLTIAILPLLGIGGMQLFVAEAPGISPDKLTPRITETAKRLWIVYFMLTFVEMTLLRVGGMTFYDAINHAFSTMATGGFSTKDASIAAFPSPFIQWTITVFMLLAGINFTVLYMAFTGRMTRVWKNEEFKTFLFLIIAVGVLVSLCIYFFAAGTHSFEEAFRSGFFQVVSIITTTGFITHDFTAWMPLLTFAFFMMFFLGGSAGSTAGGMKIVRHIVMIKNSVLELKRQLHPSAIIPVRFNGRAVSQAITHNVTAFVLIYLLTFLAGALIMSAMGIEFMTAIGSVLATLGNIGPGLSMVGPVENYGWIPYHGKAFLTFLMLLGRLELFTVLILFTRYFWQKY